MPAPHDPAADDVSLVRRFCAGDDAAFASIVARHRADLVRYAERILRADVASAEDVVQEALWRAHRARRRIDGDLAVRAWLFRIVHNACLDELRRRRRRWRFEAELTSDLAGGGEAVPDAVLDRAVTLAALTAMAALPPRDRMAIEAVAAGTSHAELARRAGMTEGASKALLHRARRKLRARLADGDASLGESCPS